MFGTIATMKVKPGQAEAFRDYMNKWGAERGRDVKGFISATVYKSIDNPNELMMAVVFDSKDNYMANAESPEQDKEYQEMLRYLDGEPKWYDGDVIAQITA